LSVSPVKRGRKGFGEEEYVNEYQPSSKKQESIEERGSRSPDKKRRKAALAPDNIAIQPMGAFSEVRSPSMQGKDDQEMLPAKQLFAPPDERSYSPRIINQGAKGKPSIR
jgi:hypothetical protein